MTLDAERIAALEAITTATLTTILLKKGLRNVWMRGPKPFGAVTGRLVGPAFTLRFVPAREDLPHRSRGNHRAPRGGRSRPWNPV